MNTIHISIEQIYDHVLTTGQLASVIDQLRTVHDTLYKNTLGSFEQIQQTLPVFLVESLMKYAEENKLDLRDAKTAQEILEQVRAMLEKTPVAELKLPYTPSFKATQKIAQWWRDWTKQPVVISIIVDESIIAGAQISYSGTFADYSINRWLQQEGMSFLDNLMN